MIYMFSKGPTTLWGKNTKIFRYARVLSCLLMPTSFFGPHTYGVHKPRIVVHIPTEPFSPNGLVRVLNGVPLRRSRVLVG